MHATLSGRRVIVLVAECLEGMGNRVFDEWIRDCGGPGAIIARLQREFGLGGHKATAVALTMQQAEIGLVRAKRTGDMRAMGFVPFDSPPQAVQFATKECAAPRIAVMPEGG